MTAPPLQEHRYKLFTVGALGTFMATLDGSIVNVTLPTLATQLDTSIDTVAWVVLAYALTLISLLLLFGAWTEIRGYRFSYTFGFIFFLIGSLMCSFSPTIHWLIASRAVQAIGTAMFASIGPGMVATVFPPSERGKWIGTMVMMVAAGFMVGPPLGGLLLKFFSWHSIFIINLPIGIIGLFLVRRYFRQYTPPRTERRIHLVGALSIAVGLVTFVLALTFANDYPWGDVRIWGTGLVSILALSGFYYYERDPRTALIGLDIFRNRTFTASMLAATVHFMALSGVLLLVPFYLERVKGLEPSQVGMFLVIMPVGMFILSSWAGRISDRIGYRLITSVGMAGLGAGLLMFSGFEEDTALSYVVLTLVVVSVGTGLFSTPNSSAMMGAVTDRQRAIASGILATNRNIGMSVGVALSTTLFTHFQHRFAHLGNPHAVFAASYKPVVYVSAALTVIGLGLCLLRTETPHGRSVATPTNGQSPVPPA